METIGHIVFQLWTVKNNQFIRLHHILDNVDEYVSNLYTMYADSQNMIKVFYYKPVLSVTFVNKFKSYMTLFYNATSLHDTIVLMKLQKQCNCPDDLIQIISQLYDFDVCIDVEAYLSSATKNVTRKKTEQVCSMDYSEIYKTFTNRDFVNDTVSLTVNTYQYDRMDTVFPYNISVHTILDIAKCVIRSCNASSELLITFTQPTYIHVTLDGGFKVSATSLDVTKSDALWIIHNITSSKPSLEYYVDKIYNNAVRSLKQVQEDEVYDISHVNNHDNNIVIDYCCMRIQEVVYKKYDPVIKLPVTNINDIVKDERIICTKEENHTKATLQKTCRLVTYENVCTGEKSIAKITNDYVIYPEFNILENISDCIHENDADMSIQIIKNIQNIVSTFDFIPKANIWKALASLDTNNNEVTTSKCNCKLCAEDIVFEVDQKTMITHMVNILALKKEIEWCASCDLVETAEEFINKTNISLLNKQCNVFVIVNKNNTSICLSNMLEKKRRLSGMTFSSKLPTAKEINDLAEETSLMIMNKYNKRLIIKELPL